MRHKKLRYSDAQYEALQNEVCSYYTEGDECDNYPHKSRLPDSFAGKIETLHMINFMCHANLEVSFNKRVTFVTGKNGSGKSAIMAALVVVCGGTAYITGRGVGITDFIKKGETWAKISVTLINDGINSYKKNVYGKRITIIRSVSKTGASTYTCKSQAGEVVSRKKHEVDKICTALDIQIKNPICILNQDVARSFLSSTDNKMRFSLFMKATHLESLKGIYYDTVDLLWVSESILKKKKLGVSRASKEISELKKKLEYLASLEKYVKEKTSLENEYLWSLVSNEEKNLETLKEEQQKSLEKREEYDKKRIEIQTVMENLKKRIEELRDNISNVEVDKSRDIREKKNNFQADVSRLEIEISEAVSSMETIRIKFDRCQSDMTNIKEHLKEKEETALQNETERNKITNQISELENQLRKIRDAIKISQRDNDKGLEDKLQYKLTLENLRSDEKELNDNKISLKAKIDVSNLAQNSLLKYGAYTLSLQEGIEEAFKKNRFKKKPIGPCGLYVSLACDTKWAKAAETVIGGLMGTYCCDNQMDFQVLSQIMDEVCDSPRPTVVICKFRDTRHSIKSGKACIRGLPCLVDLLNFTNDVVFNTFVDQARIEKVVFFETDTQAASLMTHAQNVPKNLLMGVTVDCDIYYPAPNYRTYSGDSTKPLRYFNAPLLSKEVKEKLKHELDTVRSDLKAKRMEIDKALRELDRTTKFVTETEKKIALLKQDERRTQALINQLKNEEQSIPVIPTRASFEDELKMLRKDAEKMRDEMCQKQNHIEMLKTKQAKRIEQLRKMEELEKAPLREMAKMRETQCDLNLELNAEERKNKQLTEKIMEVNSALENVEKKIHSAKKSLAQAMKAAMDVQKERVLTDRSPEEVQELLNKCVRHLQAAETRLESKESLINEYKIKQARYKEMKKKCEILEDVVKSLFRMADEKRQKFQFLQHHTASLVSHHFQACLQSRGFSGDLKFDFNDETLDLEIIPNDGIARTDTKILSGGERSYSAVSFILAVWRAVRMPFYFLDEFDVFMDRMNRKVIMDLLLEHAKSQNKMQYIFITPQDISSIQASDIVSIYKMPDPRK